MNDKDSEPKKDFFTFLKEKEQRKLRGRRWKDKNVWYGFGLFGLVGWSLSIPMLAGLTLGIFIDMYYPSRYLWSITGLFAGVVVGCAVIYYWIRNEYNKIEEERKDDDVNGNNNA